MPTHRLHLPQLGLNLILRTPDYGSARSLLRLLHKANLSFNEAFSNSFIATNNGDCSSWFLLERVVFLLIGRVCIAGVEVS